MKSKHREWGVLRLRIRDDDNTRERIAEERAFVGPLREWHRGFYAGRLCAADWARSRWGRYGKRHPRGVREAAGKRAPRALTAEWHWVPR